MNCYIKLFIIGAVGILICTSCVHPGTLTRADQKLIKVTGFDAEIIKKIRSYTDSTFSLSTGNPDVTSSFKDTQNYADFVNKELQGLVFGCTTENATFIVEKLRDTFVQEGYMIYKSDMNFGYSPDEVTILKTTDKFDLLRFEGTSGVNYELYLEDIIMQLKEWDLVYGLNFISVGFDFVEASFTGLPKDITGFCNDLYAFCPDIVEQGTGTITALKTEILQTGMLFLWWD
jgi:hypothetical protein